jgi:PPM family protein phosphatase
MVGYTIMDIALVQKPFYDETGFDNSVVSEEHRLFGVFDGMGTQEGARAIAGLLSNSFLKHAADGYDCKQLAELIERIARSAAAYWPSNGSTATVVRVDSYGKLHFAHVGDSRLYIMKKGRIKQITADEGVGNMLLNYVGALSHGVCQMGILEADDWDALMLCTDGVTGDWPEQRVSDEEIEGAFNLVRTVGEDGAKTVADMILKMSKKNDDKTIIVAIR